MMHFLGGNGQRRPLLEDENRHYLVHCQFSPPEPNLTSKLNAKYIINTPTAALN
jgi:hypothetical protein